MQTLKVAARASDEQFKGNDHFGFRVVNNNVATSVGDAKSNIPNGFELFDNYPNPFNPTTTIKFSIPALETRHVSSLQTVLSVYDLLGNQVAELVNESKPAGTYTVKFDASNLSSGTYFYQLRAGNVTLTKKLILMK
ncbi:MAG: T9SS type A sorting domain-containing protein [Melioribacteraceae bacterium]|nr:T9SS type A sorting domain-containing protein [Melioribacteraceae bacterium]MCF8264089.1 T9SS type A sorting domain-containing protein [Melioribacteraceae bacterium]MCF8413137.1 T9SS type A sorting domain-containing protein [Melioribacteraceae bacterium]